LAKIIKDNNAVGTKKNFKWTCQIQCVCKKINLIYQLKLKIKNSYKKLYTCLNNEICKTLYRHDLLFKIKIIIYYIGDSHSTAYQVCLFSDLIVL
jgi:hypothetical protein